MYNRLSRARKKEIDVYKRQAIREGIARDRFPFAYAWQSPGKKSRSFVIDKEGFRTFLVHSLGWDAKVVDAEFKSAGIH